MECTFRDSHHNKQHSNSNKHQMLWSSNMVACCCITSTQAGPVTLSVLQTGQRVFASKQGMQMTAPNEGRKPLHNARCVITHALKTAGGKLQPHYRPGLTATADSARSPTQQDAKGMLPALLGQPMHQALSLADKRHV